MKNLLEEMKKLEEIFNQYPYVAAAYVFGSHVSGKTTPMSDIDIAILLKEGAPKGRMLIHDEDYIAFQIGKSLCLNEVDVIDLNSKGLPFQHTVVKTGKLIYDADSDFRVRFVSNMLSQYLDFEPTLRAFNKHHIDGILGRMEKL